MNNQQMTIIDVVEKQLCTGCGACSYIEPDRFRMGNVFELGRRPFVKDSAPAETGEAIMVCPGLTLSHDDEVKKQPKIVQEMFDAWGPVFAVWEGYANNSAIRLAGSSGGTATALALYCIEKGGMGGVLHTAASNETPYLNQSVYSTHANQLLERTGSRYSPASPCDSLAMIENASLPSVFIGKPCDVAAVQRARKIRPKLDEKVGVTIGFFCAGVPAFNGLFELLNKNGVKNPKKQLTSLRFRGNGWPGLWTANYVDDNNQEKSSQLTYAESWGFLQRFRQWRCYICPDHSGEFADIAVGDPWYRSVEPGEPGKSLIVARTQRGYELIQAAVEAGYLVLEKNELSLLPKSQPNLLGAREVLWARLNVMKVSGAAKPNFHGYKLFKFWMNLPFLDKLKSHASTFKRVYTKKLYKRIKVTEWNDN